MNFKYFITIKKKLTLLITFLSVFLFFNNLNAQLFVFDLLGQTLSFLNTNRTLISGSGTNVGTVYRYNNVVTEGTNTVYALVTVVSASNATITTFDDDAQGTNTYFQPVISTNGGTGVRGLITYKFEFFDTATNTPTYLLNFNFSGFDIDGNSASQRELYQVSNYTNYVVNNPTGLTISHTSPFTEFLGITTNLNGLTFDNSAAFITLFSKAINTINIKVGSLGTIPNRQYSMVFGEAPGTFTNPANAVANPNIPIVDTNLQVAKTANTMSPNIGSPITFTLTAVNNGPSNATNVNVKDILPSGYTFVSATPSVGTYNSTTQNWSIGNLNNGVIQTITINATVNATGIYTNIAGITGAEIDSDTSNNSSTITPIPICYKPAQTVGTALNTNHGITALGRAGADNSNWPMVRKGAWTILEAKTKGFVVNRLTDTQISAIPSADLKEGMMVYNTIVDCLQINVDGTASGWKCFNTQACPD